MLDFIKRMIAFIITHFITFGIIIFIAVVAVCQQIGVYKMEWDAGSHKGVIIGIGVWVFIFLIVKLPDIIKNKKRK